MSEIGVIAIIRLRHHEPTDALYEALIAGGVGALEVTLPTPGSLAVVARWSNRGGAAVGAGTARDRAGAAAARDAGASFLVTPTTDGGVLEVGAKAGLPVYCGATTPTEIERAHRGGAAAVKVFPVGALGGPSYLKAVMEPLDDIPLVPTGGVGAENATSYARLGCVGAGVGSSIVDEELVAAGRWGDITERAAGVVAAWELGVESRS
ncbi:bifunctional 4-hydroxy-2-oxoglutarate aldolase/2-dehydro-3-deoxy-phosphogluconate aldolase [Isoptericola halotolerans]|uniref:bifunctional 4-hydroxy-2-oxoglutarate aldolase/2-dehydro-3-deoxy-phosphogluconate aldolase n=1 Tax=Isoptericola halotolerans TaxID=300560 RepID=UPI003890ED5D